MIGSIDAINGLVGQSCKFCVIELIPSVDSLPRGGTTCPRDRVDGAVAQVTPTFHIVLAVSDSPARPPSSVPCLSREGRPRDLLR